MSWNSIFNNCLDHLTKKAAQTYKWNSENPSGSDYNYMFYLFMIVLYYILIVDGE